MVSIFLRFFTQNIIIEKFKKTNWITNIIFFDRLQIDYDDKNINWEELYPFDKNDKQIKRNTFLQFKDKIINIENKIEKYTKDYLINRIKFVELAATCEKIIGWDLYESVYDLSDGYLTEIIDKIETAPLVLSLYNFNNFLSDINIDFLYIQCPYKIHEYDIIYGSLDYSNENANNLLKDLSNLGIPYLDLRESIDTENLEHHKLFYKTDHHWKAETGLWASKIISVFLNTKYNFNIDLNLFDPKYYNCVEYNKQFLGSLGRKITLARSQPENITLIYPHFYTNFSFWAPQKGINSTGDFSIFFWYEQINKIDYYNLDPYSTYLYGRNPIVTINNNLIKDNGNILFIIDSFGRVVAPFLAVGIEHIVVLDLRHFNGSVENYIKNNNFDIVIVMYNPTFGDKELFEFK
jgi:hypothetical protein